MALAAAHCGADPVTASRNVGACADAAREIEQEAGRTALPYGVHVGRRDRRRRAASEL
jgi:hypothetical protein